MIRALLVDDEAPARSELAYLLAEHGDVAVVGKIALPPPPASLTGAKR